MNEFFPSTSLVSKKNADIRMICLKIYLFPSTLSCKMVLNSPSAFDAKHWVATEDKGKTLLKPRDMS